MQVLVSVRDLDEAMTVARAGADVVDLKEPDRGALGGLEPADIARIVAALRDAGAVQPVSATIGDWPMHAHDAILERVDAVARCGVDTVKIGIDAAEPGARALVRRLAACGHPVALVFIADRGLDLALLADALAAGCRTVMADTADKRAGSLFDCVPLPQLRDFVRRARGAGALVGLAGALREAHLPLLASLAPDFAGFRGAVCAGLQRGAALDPARLASLRAALEREASQAAPGGAPSSKERMRASSAQ